MMNAAEFIYEGNRIVSASFHLNQNKLNKLLTSQINSLIKTHYFRTYNKCKKKGEYKKPFLFAVKKATLPYKGKRIYSIYFKGFAYRCEKSIIRGKKWRKLPELLHHTRSYKLEFHRGRHRYIAFKYYTPQPELLDFYYEKAKNANAVPEYGIPLLIGLWDKIKGFEIYWETSTYWANKLAKSWGLPEHTKSIIKNGPFVITTSHKPSGELLKVKFYYREGYTNGFFANEPHLVYRKSTDDYVLYDLKNRKIIRQVLEKEKMIL